MVDASRDYGVNMALTGVNHWTVAISSHSTNHPSARHFLMEIEDAPATEIFPEGVVDVMWASPECTEHSYAKGGKSINDQRRANAFSIPRLINELKRPPKIVIVENVVPFTKWGPVVGVLNDDGTAKLDGKGEHVYRPVKERKGETFREWFAEVEAAGPTYTGEWREMNAADYGEAQSRTRFFAVFTAPGISFKWPEPTHDKLARDGRQKWVGARKHIDRSLPIESIFHRDRPLSENTIERIKVGVNRFCSAVEEAFLIVLRRNADAQSLDTPIPSITTGSSHGGGHVGLIEVEAHPFIGRNQTHNVPTLFDEPASALTTAYGGGLFVTEPVLEPFVLGQQGGSVARSYDDPIPTLTQDGYVRVIEPFVVSYAERDGAGSGKSPAAPHGLDEPLATVLTRDRFGIAEPFLIDVRHGDRPHQPRSLDDPTGVLCTKSGLGVTEPIVEPFMVERDVRSLDEPALTLTTTNRGHRYIEPIVEAFLLPQQAHPAQSLDRPVPAIVTSSHHAVIEPFLTATFGERKFVGKPQRPRVHSIDEPTPVVTHRGAGDYCEPILEQLEDVDLTAIDPELRKHLIYIDGVLCYVDIRFRMLQPKELKQFQGLDPDYKLSGNKSDQTAQIGNAVSRKVARALGQSAFAALGYTPIDAEREEAA